MPLKYRCPYSETHVYTEMHMKFPHTVVSPPFECHVCGHTELFLYRSEWQRNGRKGLAVYFGVPKSLMHN